MLSKVSAASRTLLVVTQVPGQRCWEREALHRPWIMACCLQVIAVRGVFSIPIYRGVVDSSAGHSRARGVQEKLL